VAQEVFAAKVSLKNSFFSQSLEKRFFRLTLSVLVLSGLAARFPA
jgi:hypothetical protein